MERFDAMVGVMRGAFERYRDGSIDLWEFNSIVSNAWIDFLYHMTA